MRTHVSKKPRINVVARIELDLSRHCIATEVKRLHNRRISEFLKGSEHREELEAEITLLTRALEELDLPAMRGHHRVLAGGDSVKVVLFGSEDTPLFISVEGYLLNIEGYGKG
jgi:hypothetical protein